MLSRNDILETIRMIDQQHLDIRTITMGISLLSCADRSAERACEKIYDKISRYAERLVATGEEIEREFGIPIVNKRVSVTPIALVAAASETEDYVPFAKALDRAAKNVGVNFIGGFSALVQKGMTDADRKLIAAIPEALACTDLVCSSAMAYKRNPMRCERIVSLARYIINDAGNAADTAAAQWLERTLDDSANRRIAIPEAFLAADSILTIVINVISGGTVYPKVMEKHLREELPFIASENILMDAVGRGGDRQELHELIRQYSQQAAYRVKSEGLDNNLLDLLKADPKFGLTDESLAKVLDIRKFVGCAPEQTEEFLAECVKPVIEANKELLGTNSEINV